MISCEIANYNNVSNSDKDEAVSSDSEMESESVSESLKIFWAGSELHKITYFLM